MDQWFKRYSSPFKRLLIGGSALGIIIFLVPPLYGEGYDTINHVLSGNISDVIESNFFNIQDETFWYVSFLLLGLIFLKVTAMSLTSGAGGIGGVFAPTLFTGSISGFLVAYVVNHLNIFPTKFP